MDKPTVMPCLSFPWDTQLTLDAVHHRCDPKQGSEKTFLYVEYVLKIGGILWTIETAPIADDSISEVKRYITLEEFVTRWPEYRLYPRAGHFSNYEKKDVDNEEK